jgi:transcriptional regulator with XRE-family HTH domain
MKLLNTATKEAMGDRVRELRTSLGLTQVQFAERIGTTRAVVAAIEGGRGTGLDVLIQIATTFKKDVGELLSDTPLSEQAFIEPIDFKQDYDDRFNELPEFLKAYSKAMTVQLAVHFGIVDLKRSISTEMLMTFVEILKAAKQEGTPYEDVIGATASMVQSYAY